jgi:hypothetical protein
MRNFLFAALALLALSGCAIPAKALIGNVSERRSCSMQNGAAQFCDMFANDKPILSGFASAVSPDCATYQAELDRAKKTGYFKSPGGTEFWYNGDQTYFVKTLSFGQVNPYTLRCDQQY